jgi:NAD-dependent dihydropyrimidine dehydrogenase PreA subunit
MKTEIYEKLREQLNKLPLGAPKTDKGVELTLLKKLFTEEEAKIATFLTPFPEPVDAIAKRVGIDKKELSEILEKMAYKGLIFRMGKGEQRVYNLVPIIPGIYEFQVNKIDREIAEMFEEYFASGLAQEIFSSSTPWMKVVPVEREIPSQIEIFPYEKVSEIIKEADIIAVADCICRKEQKLVGKGCQAPADNCLLFSHWASFYIENGLAQQINQEQALNILNKAEEAGLVHCTGNTQLGHFAICNCCGCCCGVLRGITQLKNPQAVAKSGFILNLNTEDCIGCGVCVDRCQVKAFEIQDDVAVLDRERCIGCGVCIITCPNDALSLERKGTEEISVPAKDFSDLMIKIAQEKGRI